VIFLLQKVPLVFSPPQLLEPLWHSYKVTFIEPSSGRTIDPNRSTITTSEGESYTMLRAVWRGDKTTFDSSWAWTQANLERPDHLFSWLYLPAGTSTPTLTAADIAGKNNTASDGDTNIALALVFAYTRWQDPKYLDAARATISSIWQNETVVIQGKAYVLADNVEKTATDTPALVNPSYLNPAAYRIFALVDTTHPWLQAVDGTYALLPTVTTSALDTSTSASLPPDWILMDKKTGVLSPATSTGLRSDFGYDAMRVVWNIALDKDWNEEPRATAYLNSLSFLDTQWKTKGTLMATYAHDGSVSKANAYETPAMYGATIGYFMTADPSAASAIYKTKLEALFDSDSNTWRETLSYYDDNMAWFGIGLYYHLLPNLAKDYPVQTLKTL
jgi:endoglucanase